MTTLSLTAFAPEIFLAFSLLIQLIFNTYKFHRCAPVNTITTSELLFDTGLILMATLFLLYNTKVEGYFYGCLAMDISTRYIKMIFLTTCILVLLPVWRSYVIQKIGAYEFFTLFLVVILASMLLISCCDFFFAFLLLELQAFCFYIMASIKRNSVFSAEAGHKYFTLGSIFSCFFLFAISIILIKYGTTNFNVLSAFAATPALNFSLPGSVGWDFNLALCIILLVIIFKLGIVPTHFWVSEIYDGAPLCSTIVFSVIPKIALVTLLVRIFAIGFPLFDYLNYVFLAFGLASAYIGTLYALRQSRFKLFYIFSSVSQIGFALTVFYSFSESTVASLYFFLIVYNVTAIIGWFIVCAVVSYKQQLFPLKVNLDTAIYLSEVVGLFKVNKFWAFITVLYFFSLAGLPPFLGFFAKLYIFLALMESANYVILFLLMLVAGVSTYYYVRIIKAIIYEPEEEKSKQTTLFTGDFNFEYKDLFNLVLCFCVFILVFSFFFSNKFLLIAHVISCGFFN